MKQRKGTPNIRATILFREHNEVRHHWSVEITIIMLGTVDTIQDDILDKAIFRSWNKHKREYQD